MGNQKRVVIAGAGMIGVSIAYYLAKAGASVTLVEKGEPASGTTADSFAWINASRGKRPYHYYQLNRMGIAAWRELDRELEGKLHIKWGGSVEWQDEPKASDRLQEATAAHQAWGYPLQTINGEWLSQMEPNINRGETGLAFYSNVEGHVDPVVTALQLLDAGMQIGVKLMKNCSVIGINHNENQAVTMIETTNGMLEADVFVIAAGNGTPELAQLIGLKVPLKPSPGVLAHTKPNSALINRVVLSPHGHMKQKPDGRVVVGASFEGGSDTEHTTEAGRRLLDHAAQSLPHLSDMDIDKVTLGWRVLPEDRLPIIGFAANQPTIYLAAMHSGITLGPLVGQLATLEIVEGVVVEPLKPYRLERFS